MKRIRIITGVLVALATISFSAHAQDKLDKLYAETTAEQRAETQTARMQTKLNLREDQRSSVYDVNLKYAQKMEATYKAGGTKAQRFRNMKAVSDEKDTALKKVMDTDQFALYLKYKEELKEEMKARAKEKAAE